VNADTLWGRLVRGVRRLRQVPDWAACAGAGWADRIMGGAVTDRLHVKQGRSTGRLVLRGPGGCGRELAVYLKRHHRLPWWQRLLATLWRGGGWSPAFREWDHLGWARRQGLPAPEPVAAGEFAGPWGRLESFLAVRELTGMLPLHEALPRAAGSLGPPAFRAWKRGLAEELARLTRLLHDRRCFHKDLYLCHFFIHADDTRCLPGGATGGWRGRVHLIDLHRLAHHPRTWHVWRVKDLAQLLYSSEVPGIEVRDRVCFWRHYRGLLPARAADSWLLCAVRLKWRCYRAHNLRRKARVMKAPDANRP
jgi:hypothetical protein